MDKELFSQLLCKKKPLFVYLFNCVIAKKEALSQGYIIFKKRGDIKRTCLAYLREIRYFKTR